jgi:hypothetical protein
MDFRKKQVFVPGKPFQPHLVFAGKAGAYPSKAPSRCFTLGETPSLTHKYQTRLKRLARDKHSSLSRKSVNYGRNKFYDTGPRGERIDALGSTVVEHSTYHPEIEGSNPAPGTGWEKMGKSEEILIT